MTVSFALPFPFEWPMELLLEFAGILVICVDVFIHSGMGASFFGFTGRLRSGAS